MLESLI